MSSLLTEGDLTHEAHVVWLEDPENLDYVRQALDKTPRRRNKPRYARDGRMVGYAELDDHAEGARRLAVQSQCSDHVPHPSDGLAVRTQDRQARQPGDEDAGVGGHGLRV